MQSQKQQNKIYSTHPDDEIPHCRIFQIGFKPQDQALLAFQQGNVLFAQDVKPKSGQKRYLLFENEKYALEYARNNNALYEFIHNNTNTCIIYDIDLDAWSDDKKTIPKYGMKNIARELQEKTILNVITKTIYEEFTFKNFNPIIQIDYACCKNKASYHIRIDNIFISNHSDYKLEAKIMNENVKKQLEKLLVNDELTLETYEKINIIDWKIYTSNRVFRFKGQGKCRNSRIIVSEQNLSNCFAQLNKTFTPEMQYYPLMECEANEQEELKDPNKKKKIKQIPKDFEARNKEKIQKISEKTIMRKSYKESEMAKIFTKTQNLNVITKNEIEQVFSCITYLLDQINSESEHWFAVCNFLARLEFIFEQQIKDFGFDGVIENIFVDWGASEKYGKYKIASEQEKQEIRKINIKIFKKFREETITYKQNPSTHLTFIRMVKKQQIIEQKLEELEKQNDDVPYEQLTEKEQNEVDLKILKKNERKEQIKVNIKILKNILSKNIDQYLEDCKSKKKYEIINEKYIPWEMLDCPQKIVICESAMGSGKSYSSMSYAIRKNFKSTVAGSIKIMQSMQHVQDFESIKNDLREKGEFVDEQFNRMVNYQEFPGFDILIPEQKMLTVCINSFCKISACEYLYIDEIDSFLKQLDDYQKIDRNIIFQKLAELFRGAKKIFLSSANINVHTDIFIEGILKACDMTENDVKYVRNIYQPQKDRLYKMYESHSDILAALSKEVLEKKNIMVCCDSFTESEKISRFILQVSGIDKEEIKNMLTEKDEKEQLKTQKLLQTINSRTSNFTSVKNIIAEKNFPKFLIISPSIIQGISIPEKYYDSMFCIYKSQSIDPMDMLQQSFRLRSNSDAHIYIQKNNQLVFYNSREKQIKFYQKNTDLLNKNYFVETFDNNTFKIKFDFTEFTNKMMLENMYQKAYMKQNFQGRLKTLILDLGAKIEYIGKSKNQKKIIKIVKKIMKEAQNDFEEDRAEMFNATAKEMMNDSNLMHSMIYRLSKKNFGVGFDESKKNLFLYQYSEENIGRAIKYIQKYDDKYQCDHPWECKKCCLHFKNIRDVKGTEIIKEEMQELCNYMAVPKTRKLIVYLSAGLYYEKHGDFINKKFITDASLFLSSYQQQLANFQKMISLVGFSMDLKIAEKKINVTPDVIKECRKTLDIIHPISSKYTTVVDIRNATFEKIYKDLERLETKKKTVRQEDDKTKTTTIRKKENLPIMCLNIIKEIM